MSLALGPAKDRKTADRVARFEHVGDWLMGVEQVAEYTGLSVAYLNRLRHTGGGCRFSKVGTRCLYRLTDVDAWINSKRRTSTADTGVTNGGDARDA